MHGEYKSRLGKLPYLIKEEVTYHWNREYDQSAICECGHTYERHFDSYEDMAPVGCKYCLCYEFERAEDQLEALARGTFEAAFPEPWETAHPTTKAEVLRQAKVFLYGEEKPR